MNKKRIFYLSFAPIIIGALVALLFTYVARADTADFNFLAWEELLADLVPVYLGVVTGIVIFNIGYTYLFAKNRYDVVGTILCNLGGLLVSILVFIAWHVS